MANETVYPLATTDGQYIPLDIVKARFTFPLAISGVVSPNVALPDLNVLLSLFSNVDVLISFSAVAAAIPANATPVNDLLFLPANHLMVAIPTSLNMSAIAAAGANGTLWVSGTVKWEALGKPVMFERK